MASPGSGRLASVDVVRGAVMILMALDHVRDFVTNVRFAPENLARGTAALFATRWVTHFCAPTFFLLAGIGIGLQMQRQIPRSARDDKAQIPRSARDHTSSMSRYLVTRGLWLLVLELIVTPIGWRLSFNLLPAFAVVLWALGFSMIIMAAVIHAPKMIVLAVSLLLIGGHNAFDAVQPAAFGSFAWLWIVLHGPGFVIPGKLLVAYPLIPWVAVMALGWVLADVYRWEQARRRPFLIYVGVAAIVIFVTLRFWNVYGNTFPWTPQRTPALTVASFLNLRKYPPSLLFLLMTLGPALVALALTEHARGRVAKWIAVYGRVPMFYYVCHIFVAHLIGVALARAQGGMWMRIPAIVAPETIPAWYGVGLPGVYLAWAATVAIMYWPCREFERLKATRNDWWLRYL